MSRVKFALFDFLLSLTQHRTTVLSFSKLRNKNVASGKWHYSAINYCPFMKIMCAIQRSQPSCAASISEIIYALKAKKASFKICYSCSCTLLVTWPTVIWHPELSSDKWQRKLLNIRRQCGRAVRAPDLKSGDPEFKSLSDCVDETFWPRFQTFTPGDLVT